MAAYLIAEHKISNPQQFERYRQEVGPIIAAHGGRYVTRPGSHKVLAGDWQPDRVVVIEFPDMAALMGWYESPEYQPVMKLRHGATVDVLLAVDGQ